MSYETQPTRSAGLPDARGVRAGLGLLLVVWLALCTSDAAAACLLSNRTLTFGTINPQSTATVYTSGTADISCTGLQSNRTYSACLAIGAGSAPGSTGAIRQISAGGNNRIPIVIKSSPSAPQEIGTGIPYPKSGPITFQTGASGNGTASFPVTVSLTGPLAVGPGSYTSTFNGRDFRATYQVGVHTQCANVTLNAEDALLTISATVVAGCTVSATAMNFGSMTLLTSPRSATSSITVNCTQGVTATIGLGNGQTGTGPSTRSLRTGVNAISYGIYRDVSHTLPWGRTAGSDTLSVLMGASTSASVTAYGLVPTQAAPTPGSYADVVQVFVTY